MTLAIVGIYQQGFDHAVNYFLCAPIQGIILSDCKVNITGALVSQLQRLFFINLSKHVQNALATREVLGRTVEEDGGGIIDSTDLVVSFLLLSHLRVARSIHVLFWSSFAKVIQERGVPRELLLAFLGDLQSVQQDECEVFSIDVAHRVEMIEQFTDVGLGTPNEDHTVAKHLVRESQPFLIKCECTKDYIEVVFQSTLMKMPWRLVPHLSGWASTMLGSERAR